MPVLGALFRSQAFKRGQSELVIIVTPVIVNPTSGRRIADADRQLRPAERLRAHPARPLPGQPARRRTRCRTASASAASSARPASSSTEGDDDEHPHPRDRAVRPLRAGCAGPGRGPGARRLRGAAGRLVQERRVRRRRQPGAAVGLLPARAARAPPGEAERSAGFLSAAAAHAADRHPAARRQDRLAAARRPAAGRAPRQHAADAGAGPAGRASTARSGPTSASTRRRSRWCSTTALVDQVPGQPGGRLRADHAAAERRLLERHEPAPTWPIGRATSPTRGDFSGSDGVAAARRCSAIERRQGQGDPARSTEWRTEPWHSPQPPRAA